VLVSAPQLDNFLRSCGASQLSVRCSDCGFVRLRWCGCRAIAAFGTVPRLGLCAVTVRLLGYAVTVRLADDFRLWCPDWDFLQLWCTRLATFRYGCGCGYDYNYGAPDWRVFGFRCAAGLGLRAQAGTFAEVRRYSIAGVDTIRYGAGEVPATALGKARNLLCLQFASKALR
jgi:hypothetical protein